METKALRIDPRTDSRVLGPRFSDLQWSNRPPLCWYLAGGGRACVLQWLESCAGKGPTKPERSMMSRQSKTSKTVLQSWGFCVGPTTLWCKKSASYRNRSKEARSEQQEVIYIVMTIKWLYHHENEQILFKEFRNFRKSTPNILWQIFWR